MRIAEHLTNEPTIVQYLVSVSIRGIALSSLAATLQRGDISANVRVRLESELAKYDDNGYFAKALISERAFGNSMCQELPWPWRRWFQNEYLMGMQNPFTEQPLIVRKLGSGWLIYSVGRDLKDDGGDVDVHDDGIAPFD